MLGPIFSDIAAKHSLTMSAGMAYGMLNGCFVTLSQDTDVLRISIYVGPQEQPAPGYSESVTVSCARQLCHAVSTASGPDNLYCLMTDNEAVPALVLNHAGSVVTINFRDEPESRTGIERLIDEVLPQAAALTRPGLCIYCCTETAGSACPVRLSADTVVPMHEACYKKAAEAHRPPKEEQSRQLRAVLGAALGALVGAVIWSFLAGFGPLAWVSAVLMGLLPTLLYDLLKGKPGTPRIVTILSCAFAAVVIGSIGSILVNSYRVWTANESLMQINNIGFWAYTQAAFRVPPSGFVTMLLKHFIVGLIFAGIGCIACFRRSKQDLVAAAANANKPRRLRGKF